MSSTASFQKRCLKAGYDPVMVAIALNTDFREVKRWKRIQDIPLKYHAVLQFMLVPHSHKIN